VFPESVLVIGYWAKARGLLNAGMHIERNVVLGNAGVMGIYDWLLKAYWAFLGWLGQVY